MKKVLLVVFSCALVMIAFKSFTNASGPGGGDTNAPNESNCTRCHSGTLNSGGFSSTFKLTGNFTGNGYIPDSTYTITVEHAQSGISKYGMQVTVLDDANAPVGDLINKNSRTQKRTKTVSGATRQYIEHTSSGTSLTGTNKVDWTFEWKAPSSNKGDVFFYASLNATNKNNGTSGDTIYAKKFVVSPSTLLPIATIVTSDTNICAFSVANFKGTGTNSPTTYDWKFANGSPSQSSNQDPSVNYNVTGTHIAQLRVKNSKGWSGWDTVKVKVNPSPSAFIQGGDRTICKGGSTKLSVGSGTGNTYKWSSGETTSTIDVTTAGKYSVVVTNSIGCFRQSNEITVGYHTEPGSSLKSNAPGDSICAGSMVRFTADQGFDSFFWYKDNNMVSGSDTNIYDIQSTTSAAFKVKVKDVNGCISAFSDTVDLTVLQKLDAPKIRCFDKTPFSITWEWDPVAQFQGYQVSTDGQIWGVPSSGNYNETHTLSGLSPNKDYTLFVRAQDIAPCFFSPVSKLVCKTGTCDSLLVQFSYPNEVCKGDEVEVKINGLAGKKYALYLEQGPAFTDTIFRFTPSIDKAYSLEVEDSTNIGCPPAQYFINIKVDEIALLNFGTQKQNNVFCLNDTVQFKATSGNDVYRFYVNNELRQTTSDSFYYESKFDNNDTAFVEVEKGACMAKSEKIGLSVVPKPDAGFTHVKMGSIYDFSPVVNSYQNYFWEFGNGFTSVLMEPSIDFKDNSGEKMSVKLNVTDNNQCKSDSSGSIDLPDFGSIAELKASGLEIYPSPVQSNLTIVSTRTDKVLCFEVLDLKGQKVFNECSPNTTSHLNLSNLASGLYTLRIVDENQKTWDVKILKQ
jgi:hypothetical protein